MLPTSRWPWTRETAILFGSDGEQLLRARFVGQIDFLWRCLDAASTMARASSPTGQAWLANLDLDEYLLPANVRVAKRDRPEERLPLVLRSASLKNDSVRCLALRRHNFYSPETEIGFSTLSAAARANISSEAPMRRRRWRAPFPPWPKTTQPFLPKWITRVPASPQLLVNNHEVWFATGCHNRCNSHRAIPSSSSSSSFSTAAVDSEALDDPAGLAGVLPAEILQPLLPVSGASNSSASRLVEASAGALGGTAGSGSAHPLPSLRLLASLLSPMATPCYLPPALLERCVLGGRVGGMPFHAMLPAADMLPSTATTAPVAPKASAGTIGARGAPPPDYRRRRRLSQLAEGSNRVTSPPAAAVAAGHSVQGSDSSALRTMLQQSLQRCIVTGNLNASVVGGSGGRTSSSPAPVRPLRFCWQEACLRGAQRRAGCAFIIRPTTKCGAEGARPSWARAGRSGEPEEDALTVFCGRVSARRGLTKRRKQ